MRKILYPLFFSIIFMACSTDDEQALTPESGGLGKQSFSIDYKDVNGKNPSNKTTGNLEPVFALISIADANGNVIHTRKKFSLTKVDEKYVTEEIPLASGSYSLTEFIVTDADNMVISLTPKVNSTLAQLTGTPLPFAFIVETDKTNITSPENIDANGFTSIHFGYGELDLTFPLSTDSFNLTIDESTLGAPKSIALKSYGASTYTVDWGDGTIEEYKSNGTNATQINALTHTYAEANIYTVNISGPIVHIEEFNFYSNDIEGGWPVKSNIISVDVNKLILLKKCEIYFGNLSTLDTSKNTVLETLSLGYNELTSLDFTYNPNLKTIWLRHNQLPELDVSKNPEMEHIWVTGNQISDLDISNNAKLMYLDVRENELTSLNVANNLNLKTIDLSDNLLPNVDLSNNVNLNEINFGRNKLTTIDLAKNTNLVRIDLYGNQIADIDLSLLLNLRDIYIDGNLLTGLDLSNNPKLERLIIEHNDFSTLDITNNPKIFDLEIGDNQFDGTQLDQLITHVYDQAVLNSIMNGYIDFKNNPGSDEIDSTTTDKINELAGTYSWFFNNN